MMADFMLNHISIRSEEFRDYMKNGDNSPVQRYVYPLGRVLAGRQSHRRAV